MADVHDKETRSYNMSQIKGKDSKPEMVVRRFLFANGFRYRLHDKNLPGKPDIVLKIFNTVIFVHGCFWHAHDGCKYYVVPKTRTKWWIEKLNRNKQKDSEDCEQLVSTGWRVITIWECELKPDLIDNTLNSLLNKLK